MDERGGPLFLNRLISRSPGLQFPRGIMVRAGVFAVMGLFAGTVAFVKRATTPMQISLALMMVTVGAEALAVAIWLLLQTRKRRLLQERWERGAARAWEYDFPWDMSRAPTYGLAELEGRLLYFALPLSLPMLPLAINGSTLLERAPGLVALALPVLCLFSQRSVRRARQSRPDPWLKLPDFPLAPGKRYELELIASVPFPAGTTAEARALFVESIRENMDAIVLHEYAVPIVLAPTEDGQAGVARIDFRADPECGQTELMRSLPRFWALNVVISAESDRRVQLEFLLPVYAAT